MKEALKGHKPGKKKKEGKIKAEYKERWFEAYFSPSVKQGEITKSAK